MKFQHTAARRRLAASRRIWQRRADCFNTQPPEGGWGGKSQREAEELMFQHTAARRRLGSWSVICKLCWAVSTHSRPKAAGCWFSQMARTAKVSTHSRPKAAGEIHGETLKAVEVSTHSRPKAAGASTDEYSRTMPVSTHSRPKAAGGNAMTPRAGHDVSTHSRPKAAGADLCSHVFVMQMFQHTAARRRLAVLWSRFNQTTERFNTQPPEGGWFGHNPAFL